MFVIIIADDYGYYFHGWICGIVNVPDPVEALSSTDLPVRIHVEQYNPALGLYHRLGFREISDKGVYWLLEWKPATKSKG